MGTFSRWMRTLLVFLLLLCWWSLTSCSSQPPAKRWDCRPWATLRPQSLPNQIPLTLDQLKTSITSAEVDHLGFSCKF